MINKYPLFIIYLLFINILIYIIDWHYCLIFNLYFTFYFNL